MVLLACFIATVRFSFLYVTFMLEILIAILHQFAGSTPVFLLDVPTYDFSTSLMSNLGTVSFLQVLIKST